MRRSAPTLPVSPKLLKHFAIATVVLTALLALFASGEDWGAQAQLEAADAKNQLVAKEAEKLGTRKLAAKLKVKSEVTSAGFGDEGGGDFSGGGGGGGWGGAAGKAPRGEPGAGRPRFNAPPHMPMTPGASMTVTGQAAEDLPGKDPGKRKHKAGEKYRPDSDEIEKIKEKSRIRTGGRGSSDG